MGAKRYDEAEKCYRKRIEIKGNLCIDDIANLYKALKKQNKHDEAKEYMDKVINHANNLQEEDENPLGYIAYAFYNAGQYEDAFTYFKRKDDFLTQKLDTKYLDIKFNAYINFYNAL